MQSHIRPTTTQLDVVRVDAAARQRRAATYRIAPQQDAGRTRQSLVAGLMAAALTLGIVTGAAAHVIASQPVQQGYEAGLPDGWFNPGEPTVRVAGVVIDRAALTNLVPSNVR